MTTIAIKKTFLQKNYMYENKMSRAKIELKLRPWRAEPQSWLSSALWHPLESKILKSILQKLSPNMPLNSWVYRWTQTRTRIDSGSADLERTRTGPTVWTILASLGSSPLGMWCSAPSFSFFLFLKPSKTSKKKEIFIT